MTTTLLYLEDDHRTEFEATVLAHDPVERTLVLDATCFFPLGGHQHADQGRIAKDGANYALVTDVRKAEDGTVTHHYLVLRGALAPGDRVTGTIEADRRRHHMGLHSAQHVFSAYLRKRFDVGTGRADFSPDGGMVVLERELPAWDLALLEEDVNRAIERELPVRRVSKDGIHTIHIGDLDASPCCGTHVANTRELGAFKLTSIQGKVLHYEVGSRARREATRLANHALETASALGLEHPRDLQAALAREVERREAAEAELAAWKEDLTKRRIARARAGGHAAPDGTFQVYGVDLTHLSTKPARDLLKRELVSDGEVWLGLCEGGSLLVASSADAVSARDVVEAFVPRWELRGGGNRRFAQAGPVPDSVADPLDEVARWLASSHSPARS